jgi:hypothetical protein
MTIRAATERLWQAVHQLRDDLLALLLQAVEDRPLAEPNKLVEDVGAAADALAGWAEEMLDGAARAMAAADYPPTLSGIRRALGSCTGAIERLGADLHEELAPTRRLDELTALARSGGPELRAWVAAIKSALDQAQQSVWTAQAALTTCWREFAEPAVPGPVPASEPAPADPARRT